MSLLKKAQKGPSMMSKAAAQVQNDVLFGTSANFPRVVEVDLTSVDRNPDQPRQHFDEEDLRSLADSIERMGLKQPILVKQAAGGRYVIAAGERRFRAHQLLGRETIFAIITDGDIDEIALIENLQRADLDAMEEARAFARLLERHKYTHEELGRIVSKSQGEIARTLATLKLPEDDAAGVFRVPEDDLEVHPSGTCLHRRCRPETGPLGGSQGWQTDDPGSS